MNVSQDILSQWDQIQKKVTEISKKGYAINKSLKTLMLSRICQEQFYLFFRIISLNKYWNVLYPCCNITR